MKWTKAQQRVIDTRNCNLLVSAAAGSGKTAVLVERILQMITDKTNPIDVDRLLVVTFTKAAAAQMREKISRALYEWQEKNPADTHLTRQLSLIHHASITTIDSFCLQVVRENFQVLGLDPGFRIAEQAELAALASDAMGEALEVRYQTKDAGFLELLDCYCGDKSDSNIEKYITGIADVAASYPRPYEWIARAKEALLVTDEAALLQKPWYQHLVANVKAMTATFIQDTRYVEQLCLSTAGPLEFQKTCAADRDVMEGVLAADSYQALGRAFSEKLPRAAAIKKGSCDEEKAELVKKLRKQYKEKYEKLNCFTAPMETLLSDLDNVRRHMTVLLSVAQDYMRLLEQKKLSEGVLAFSDIEHFALSILVDENGPTDAAVQYRERYHEVLIDEYQDSNFLQEEILTSITGMQEGAAPMFMVGDVKQSIYKFRMARPDLFMKKYAEYTSEDTDEPDRKIELKNNFRSRAVVLEAVNDIFYQIMGLDFGGIDYDENVALVPGFPYPEGEAVSDCTELLVLDGTPYGASGENAESPSLEADEETDKLTLEARMVANRILELTGRRGGQPLYVLGEDGVHYRKASYGDIAILFRSVKNIAPVFIKELSDAGIPAVSELSQGLFETQEIKTLLTCLRVIHNPYQDIELTALLHSPLFSFTSGELAKIRLHADQAGQAPQNFYDAVCMYESKRTSYFLQLLGDWQEKSRYMDTAGLLWDILEQTNYMVYLQALEGGSRRLANVYYLISCARQYALEGSYGVYDFICYMEQLKDASLDMGEANVHGEHDDIVRIMSMHKSKGLEFPIVFVSGLGRQFNQMDSTDRILIHADDYLAADYADGKRRVKRPTLIRDAFAENIRTENIAEEFRVLYVALTRAREKLILTGSVKDFAGKVEDYRKIADVSTRKLPFGYRRGAKTYMDWIMMSFIRNPQFHDYVTETLSDRGKMRRCEYKLADGGRPAPFSLRLQIYRAADLNMDAAAKKAVRMMEAGRYLSLREQPFDEALVEELKAQLSYCYPYDEICLRRAKYSVTELKAAGRDAMKPENEGHPELAAEYEPETEYRTQTVPVFMQGKIRLNGANRGTLIHRIMQMYDFTDAVDAGRLEAVIRRWIQEGMLPEDMMDYLDMTEFTAFFESSLGRRMCLAAREDRLYKERQFTIMVPLVEVDDQWGEESPEQVLVQGIIDAYFINENGNIEIVDYKTDRGVLPMEQYGRQLSYYAATLERLTHKKVEQCYVYAFTHKKAIPVIV